MIFISIQLSEMQGTGRVKSGALSVKMLMSRIWKLKIPKLIQDVDFVINLWNINPSKHTISINLLYRAHFQDLQILHCRSCRKWLLRQMIIFSFGVNCHEGSFKSKFYFLIFMFYTDFCVWIMSRFGTRW